jgi:hypothetical protein
MRVGLRASLDIEGVGKTIFPCLGSNSGHPAKLLQLRYDQSISTRMFYLMLNCFFFQGGYVWLKANNKDEFDVPVGVKILSTQGKNIKIKDDNGEVCLLYIVNKRGNFWWQCIRLLNSVDGQ